MLLSCRTWLATIHGKRHRNLYCWQSICGVAGLRGSFPAPNRGEGPPRPRGARRGRAGHTEARNPATPQPERLRVVTSSLATWTMRLDAAVDCGITVRCSSSASFILWCKSLRVIPSHHIACIASASYHTEYAPVAPLQGMVDVPMHDGRYDSRGCGKRRIT